MIKGIITIVFLIIFGSGLYTYFSKEETSIQQRLDKDVERRPRIVMEDMQMRRMTAGVTTSHISADRAMFFEPNEIHLDGHVVATRIVNGSEELVRSDHAKVLLHAKSTKELVSEQKVESADVSGKVAIIARDHQFRTEQAHYDAASEIASSNVPVSITSASREINGAGGFRYQMRTEQLDVIGPVSGFIYTRERQ